MEVATTELSFVEPRTNPRILNTTRIVFLQGKTSEVLRKARESGASKLAGEGEVPTSIRRIDAAFNEFGRVGEEENEGTRRPSRVDSASVAASFEFLK